MCEIKFFKQGEKFLLLSWLQSLTLRGSQYKEKKVFTSHWMTSDTNFVTVKRIEKETAKKEKIKKEKERVSNEALAKIEKEQAIKKLKMQRKVVKK